MRNKHALTLIIFVTFIAKTATADIGGIGSPVVPSNGVIKKDNKAANVPAVPGQANQKPSENKEARTLITIDTSQHRSLIDPSIKQTFEDARADDPSAEYTVISSVPAVMDKRAQYNNYTAVYANNVSSVVSTMVESGIPASAIHVVTEETRDDNTQEITVMIK